MQDLPPELVQDIGNTYRIEGENVIVQQSWLNQIPLIILFFGSVYAAGWIRTHHPEYATVEGSGVSWPVWAVVPILLVAMLIKKLFDSRIVITPEYLIFVDGRVAWRERTVRLEYQRIQEIEIDFSILQRALGLGDVIVTPISTELESYVRLLGIRRPRVFKDLIRAYGRSGSDGGVHAVSGGNSSE